MSATATATTSDFTNYDFAASASTADSAASSDARPRPVWRVGARAGVLGAVATTAIAGAALGAGVPLEIEGEQIPLAGFAQLTLMVTVVGVLLAKGLSRWAARPRRTFTRATVALTMLSVVPDLTFPASTATRIALVATHVVAAAIVIPALAGRMPERSR